MNNKVFIKNAATLTGTSFIIRGIGIFFRIYMAAKIGAEGMGLYQLVFSIYVLAAAAGSGLPAAVTAKLSSLPNDRGRARPLRFAIAASMLALTLSGVVFFFSADMISVGLLNDFRTATALKILCFSLPFMGASACIKGYFISEQNTVIPSSGQIFEQLVRIGIIAAILAGYQDQGLDYACAAVILGDSIAEFASFCFYFISLMISLRKKPVSTVRVPFRREIVAASAPVTGSRYLATILHSAENIIIPGCLAAGLSGTEEAVAEFGMLKGMAIPILFFPASFLGALSTLLLPEISAAYAAGRTAKVRSAAAGAIGITLFASIPIMGVFWMFGSQIALLIYNSEGVGRMIVALAPIVPFMYLECVCDGILKGLTQQKHSFLYNIINSGVRIAAIYAFVPTYGMRGFLWIMILSNIFTSSMNIRRLLIVAKLKLPFGRFVFLPLAVTGIALVAAKYLCGITLSGTAALIFSILLSVVIYFAVMYLFYVKRGGISALWQA